MSWTEKELKRLEKSAKGKRFRCQRYCGIDCCTMLSVLVSPFSSISFIAGYFRALQILEKASFLGVEPVLGQNSLLPMLWKKEGFPCIFMRIDGQPKCAVWEDAPSPALPTPQGFTKSPQVKSKWC